MYTVGATKYARTVLLPYILLAVPTLGANKMEGKRKVAPFAQLVGQFRADICFDSPHYGVLQSQMNKKNVSL